MANLKKTYFLCSTWDYHPDGGPIQLGNIILSPHSPAQALNDPQAPRPADLFPLTTKTGVKWSTEKARSGRYGLWTEFLSMVTGLGANVSYEHSSNAEQIFVFDFLETREFSPSQDFLQRTLAASPLAVDILNRSRLRKHVYMITAVKIARGAQAKIVASRSHTGDLKATIDGTLTGAPVNLGPEFRGEARRVETCGFDGSSPFVFAFRLRRIMVHRSGQITQDEYTKGAMFDVDSAQISQQQTLVIDGLSEQDASPYDFPDVSASGNVLDDEEEVVCAMLDGK
jgi:hypothetical protein